MDPLFSFLASAPSPQPALLGTGVRVLLHGWAPAEAPTALRRSHFGGHHVPDVQEVLGFPMPLLHETLAIARELQPQEGLEG